jgi:hypothetical protein
MISLFNRFLGTRRRPRVHLQLESLEDRTVPTLTVSAVSFAQTTALTEGAANNGLQIATVADSDLLITNAQLHVTVDYGDGTKVANFVTAGFTLDTNLTVTGSLGNFTITDNKTFAEESGSTVPPFVFTDTITVTETTGAMQSNTGTATIEVLDAALSVGDPVNVGTPVQFTGGNTGNATTAAAALGNFETAIGGSKNTVAAPQNGGFRTITWDGVKTDGTDSVAGANSTVPIPAGSTHTVGIPLNRFEGSGVFFGAVYAVSNDGFTDVNPTVTGLFPAFSTPSVFAMFNDNGIDFKFVAPASPATPPVSATSRGFGAVFENVQHHGSTTIQYFNNSILLDTLTVPESAAPGVQVFAGELFANSIVTNVLLTLGDGVIFKFDGTNVTAGAANSLTNNLVSVDDWAFAEPVPTANGFPIVSGAQGLVNAKVTVNGTVGTAVSGVVATFHDTDPNGNARDYTTLINWGDGHFSTGTVAADGNGGFTVSGSNTYNRAGKFPINVDIADFGGGPGLGGSMPTLSVNNTALIAQGNSVTTLMVSPNVTLFGQPITLTAKVASATGVGAAPEGTVNFYDGSTLVGTAAVNTSGQASLTLSNLAPGPHALAGIFSGDDNYLTSTGTAAATVNFDVTSLFSITSGNPHKMGGRFHQKVVLRNKTNNSIPGPILLVLDGLSAGVKVFGSMGTTHLFPPLGSPVVMLNLQGASLFAPGFTLTLDLQFGASSAKKIHYTPRLLAGTSMG